MKPHKIAISKAGTYTVLTPMESLTFQNCEGIETLFRDLMGKGQANFILDCKAVPLMDSKSLEVLLQLHDVLRSRNSLLKLCGINETCRDILIATRLINVFSVHKEIHDAAKRIE